MRKRIDIGLSRISLLLLLGACFTGRYDLKIQRSQQKASSINPTPTPEIPVIKTEKVKFNLSTSRNIWESTENDLYTAASETNLSLAFASGPLVTGPSYGITVTNAVVSSSGIKGSFDNNRMASVVTDPDGDGNPGFPTIDPFDTFSGKIRIDLDPAAKSEVSSCSFDPPYQALPCALGKDIELPSHLLKSGSIVPNFTPKEVPLSLGQSITSSEKITTNKYRFRRLSTDYSGGEYTYYPMVLIDENSALIYDYDAVGNRRLSRYYFKEHRLDVLKSSIENITYDHFLRLSDGNIIFGAYDSVLGERLFMFEPKGVGKLHHISNIRGAGDNPIPLCELNDWVLIQADNASGMDKLFIYDRSKNTIRQYADIYGSGGDSPSSCVVHNQRAYFIATNSTGNGNELYSMSSNEMDLKRLTNLSAAGASYGPRSVQLINDRLYLDVDVSAGSSILKLFEFDLASKTLYQIADHGIPGASHLLSYNWKLLLVQDKIYYWGLNAAGNTKLFSLDTSNYKLRQVSDLYSGDSDYSFSLPNFYNLIHTGDYLSFYAFNGPSTLHMYSFDPSNGPNGQINQISYQPRSFSSPVQVPETLIGDRIYFAGPDSIPLERLFAFVPKRPFSKSLLVLGAKIDGNTFGGDLNWCCVTQNLWKVGDHLIGEFKYEVLGDVRISILIRE